MSKWIALVAAVVLIGLLWPRLRRRGLGNLPGDVRIQRNGREYYFPVTTTLVLSALLTLLVRVL
jgi:Protein of unknown function (DUF2905)